MVRGLYTAWTGLKNEQKRLDVIANNVANAATTGFKTESVTSQSFDDMLKIKVRDRSVNYDRDEKKLEPVVHAIGLDEKPREEARC